ncbi:MAG: hypothetical protein JKY51_07485 [Opitutaceae bacterium]|nr:hypothetical protein [Opitutaceae bacterium]
MNAFEGPCEQKKKGEQFLSEVLLSWNSQISRSMQNTIVLMGSCSDESLSFTPPKLLSP